MFTWTKPESETYLHSKKKLAKTNSELYCNNQKTKLITEKEQELCSRFKVDITLNIFVLCVYSHMYSINHRLYYFYALIPSEAPG